MGVSVKRAVSRVLTAVILVALVATGVFAFAHRQQINDHFEVQQFEASTAIVELTDRMALTDDGHRIFWASHPTLDASQKFNEQCSQVDHTEEGHVLGCYVSSRIHLFNISDERLNGIIEVTAVHELLHATFARLSDQDRSDLSEHLTELYNELIVDDPQLEKRMSVYQGLSRTAFANELHSVFGTEVRDLPDWLEEHYAQWLTDRGLIVDFFDSYHAIFDELKQRADYLQTEMSNLRADVERRSAEYDAAVEQFNADWERFVARNEAFEFSDNPDEFYRLRDDFYERRDALSSEMQRLNDDISRYEQMRTELLELSELNHELEQQLDSALAPPSSTPVPET